MVPGTPATSTRLLVQRVELRELVVEVAVRL
jgi:hypothetical protein